MTRTSLKDHNCSLARTVDIIGDKWALLIVRDAFYGTRGFSAFQTSLGVAKTVLSDRLQRLVDGGVLERTRVRDGVERFEYRLTLAGQDLFPLIVALVQWGDRFIFGEGREPMAFLDRASGEPVRDIIVQANNGQRLTARDVTLRLRANTAVAIEDSGRKDP